MGLAFGLSNTGVNPESPPTAVGSGPGSDLSCSSVNPESPLTAMGSGLVLTEGSNTGLHQMRSDILSPLRGLCFLPPAAPGIRAAPGVVRGQAAERQPPAAAAGGGRPDPRRAGLPGAAEGDRRDGVLRGPPPLLPQRERLHGGGGAPGGERHAVPGSDPRGLVGRARAPRRGGAQIPCGSDTDCGECSGRPPIPTCAQTPGWPWGGVPCSMEWPEEPANCKLGRPRVTLTPLLRPIASLPDTGHAHRG